MKDQIDGVNNFLLPIILAVISFVIRVSHDFYINRIDETKNYVMRLVIGILFTILGSFIISKDINVRWLDVYGTCIFLLWLFGMELSLFLLDKKTVTIIGHTVKNVLSKKMK